MGPQPSSRSGREWESRGSAVSMGSAGIVRRNSKTYAIRQPSPDIRSMAATPNMRSRDLTLYSRFRPPLMICKPRPFCARGSSAFEASGWPE